MNTETHHVLCIAFELLFTVHRNRVLYIKYVLIDLLFILSIV